MTVSTTSDLVTRAKNSIPEEFLVFGTRYDSRKMNVGHDSHLGFNGRYGHNSCISFNGQDGHNSYFDGFNNHDGFKSHDSFDSHNGHYNYNKFIAFKEAGKGLILSKDFCLADASIVFNHLLYKYTVCKEFV